MMTENVISTLNSNALIEQYEINVDLVEQMWRDGNENPCDYERAFEMMHVAKEDAECLKAEILRRKSIGTLYDGKRATIVRIWTWAKGRFADEQHLYNAVRKVMRDKYNVTMLRYENSGIFA